MHRLLLAPFIALALAGCGITASQVPWRADIDQCEEQARRSPRLHTERERLAATDRCMEAKGWRATQACRETQFEGSTAFCDYRR